MMRNQRVSCIQELSNTSDKTSVLFGEFIYSREYLPWTCISFKDDSGRIPCILIPWNWNSLCFTAKVFIKSSSFIKTNEWNYLEIESEELMYVKYSPLDYFIDFSHISHLHPLDKPHEMIENTIPKYNNTCSNASRAIQLQGRVLSKNEVFQSRSRISFMIHLECFLEFESIPCPLTCFLLFDHSCIL